LGSLGGHALVTGGGTGIGAAVARALASEGARVTLVGRRERPLAQVAVGIDAAVAVADVTRPEGVEHALAAARAAHGPITILVHNAGIAESAPIARTTADQWRRMMAINLDALFALAQASLPDLLAAEAGRIVTVASTAGLKGYPYTTAYAASKHGAIGFTRALAAELAHTNVTVNAVCPGFTETAIVDAAAENIAAKTGRTADQARAAMAATNPQGRLIDPAEVASAVVWLCRAENRSITGQSIVVAGGEIM